MSHFLNQQNKRHYKLYKDYENLVNRQEFITWIDLLFNKRSEKMYSKVNKMSPRRGKKGTKELMDMLNSHNELEILLEATEIEDELTFD